MLSLGPLHRALAGVYCLDVAPPVDDFVRPMDARDPEAARREVVLVSEDPDAEVRIAVLLAPDVLAALQGQRVRGLTRFTAWCLALEGVSHFALLGFRAANDRSVSQLELELQAEVDKFVVGLLPHARRRSPSEAQALSRRLRLALFEAQRFHDAPGSVRGERYRTAHRLAARYAATLERRYVRDGRLARLVDELRAFYRADLPGKRAMAEAA